MAKECCAICDVYCTHTGKCKMTNTTVGFGKAFSHKCSEYRPLNMNILKRKAKAN